jgi:hypothetical protein
MKIAAVLMIGLVGIGTGVFLFGLPGRDSRQAVAAPLPDQARPDTQAAPLPFPEGLLDPDRRTVFIGTAQGGLQSIRLEDGKVLWANDTIQADPWVQAGNRLIARGERIVVLDIRQDGKLLRQCDAIPYPKLTPPEKCTLSFELSSPRVEGDTLHAGWHSVAAIDRRQGRPFNFEGWTAFNQKAPAGSVKIDLTTGKVDISNDAKAGNPTGGSTDPARQAPALPAKLAEIRDQYQAKEAGRIAIIGNRLVGVSLTVVAVAPPTTFFKIVTLHSWDIKTGEEAAPVELVRDKATNIADARFTQDRHHVGVVFATARAFYSLTTGKRVGIESPGFTIQMDRVFVDGNRAYFTQTKGSGPARATPTVLCGFDLNTGKSAWEQPIKPRNTMPLPP